MSHMLGACACVAGRVVRMDGSSGNARDFLEAAANAVNNLPAVKFFRDSILSAVTRVTTLLEDSAMAALLRFAPKIKNFQDKILPVVDSVMGVLSDVQGVVTTAGDMLDRLLKPAERLGQVADTLDTVDSVLEQLINKEGDTTGVSDSASTVETAITAVTTVLEPYANVSTQAAFVLEKVTAVVDLLGFDTIEALAGNPVEAMSSASKQFVRKVRSLCLAVLVL